MNLVLLGFFLKRKVSQYRPLYLLSQGYDSIVINFCKANINFIIQVSSGTWGKTRCGFHRIIWINWELVNIQNKTSDKSRCTCVLMCRQVRVFVQSFFSTCNFDPFLT